MSCLKQSQRSYTDLHLLTDGGQQGLDIEFMAPVDATTESCTRARAGLNTISVTGNVLRDYLTDLFPIIELGTSAKMLSIVPLLAGGCLLETGAGGSAPKHVQQFVEEGHLRWDSLGEYLATAMSFEELAVRSGNESARILGTTLMEAVGCLLDEAKSPSRKVFAPASVRFVSPLLVSNSLPRQLMALIFVFYPKRLHLTRLLPIFYDLAISQVGEIDNRGSNFYIAMYWARALAKHDAQFEGLARQLAENEGAILKEMLECQGSRVDIGGYYKPDPVKVASAMRPSALFNSLMELREA